MTVQETDVQATASCMACEPMTGQEGDVQHVLSRMVDDLRWILSQPAGSLVWRGTQRDLAELVHTVWLTQELTDTLGRPRSQADLAQQAFAACGRRLPHCLSAYIAKAGQRRNPRLTLLCRYAAHPPLGRQQLVTRP